jgi:hypothetical protein
MNTQSKSLIICPVGNPLTFDDRFDKENHWRYTHDNRLYETVVFAYSDFLPETKTYDVMIKDKGFKWSLSKSYIESLNYSNYEYIGFLDDDLITDTHNINSAIKIATENNLKIFQMSVTEDSDEFFPILKNKSDVKYTKTNFVETMGMFIHSSLMPIIIDFWKQYDIYCGWGFDKVLCDITKTDAAVIHSSQMYHPKKMISTYNKSSAFAEMDKVLYEVTPKFMEHKYKEKWSFVERQYEKQIVMEIV